MVLAYGRPISCLTEVRCSSGSDDCLLVATGKSYTLHTWRHSRFTNTITSQQSNVNRVITYHTILHTSRNAHARAFNTHTRKMSHFSSCSDRGVCRVHAALQSATEFLVFFPPHTTCTTISWWMHIVHWVVFICFPIFDRPIDFPNFDFHWQIFKFLVFDLNVLGINWKCFVRFFI